MKVSLEEEKPNIVKTNVREYVVIIDLDKKTIFHYFPDYTQHINEKAFCKHIGKVFPSLPDAEAKRLLKEIYFENDSWQFLVIS